VLPQANTYLSIYFAGVSGLLIYNMGSSILRAVGDSRRPVYFLITSAVINIVFDLLFVIWFHMGVAGVAYATILAQAVSAVLVLISLTRTKGAYGLRWRQLSIKRIMLRNILSVGLPSGLQQAIVSFSNIFVQSYINFYGSACMAGWSAYNKLDIFAIIPLQSISMASMTFVGQNYGAGQLDRAREGVKKALILSVGVTALLSAALILFKRQLLMLFTTDAAVIEYGVRFINIATPFYVTLCVYEMYSGAMRGIGRAAVCMVSMLLTMVVFRQIFLFVTKLLGLGFVPVALAYPMGWITCAAILTVVYRRSELCSEARRRRRLANADMDMEAAEPEKLSR